MNSANLHKGIIASIKLFDDLEILEQPYWYSSLEPSVEFRSIAYDSSASYTKLYLAGLENRDYNLLLSDFGYIQFYGLEKKDSMDLRYAYYPNPFQVQPYKEFCKSYDVNPNETDSYEVYSQELSLAEVTSRSSAVRYDVAYGQYKELLHPTAHIHFGLHEESRWPFSRILTPEAFSFLIAKHFYFNSWVAHSKKSVTDEKISEMDKRLFAAKASCARIEASFFSSKEERQFHLT